MAYDFGFAKIYDKFTDESDAQLRVDYLKAALRRFGVGSGIVLDLACGTGRMSEALIKSGYDVISTDIAPEMLSEAVQRLRPYGARALVLQQDMRELDLFGTINACICCMDSINHLLTENDVQCVFDRVSLFTEPGGVFIFDVNTVYKHRCVLANNTFVYEDETDFLVWQNEYDPQNNTVMMLLDIFSAADNGEDTYTRQSDEIRERAYELSCIKKMLQSAGFSEIYCFGDLSFSEPPENAERVYFAAVK